MDERFKGTNVNDAFDASLERLKRLARSKGFLFVVSSNLIEFTDQPTQSQHIDYRYFEASVPWISCYIVAFPHNASV